MGSEVKGRRYDASRRRQAAAETRARILRAARTLFSEQGFAGTSVAEIAQAASVSVDTLYASVGRKPDLLLAVHDMELAEGDEPVEAAQRAYVRALREAPTAVEKIRIYSEALARVLPRTVPLLEALREAGRSDERCRELHTEIVERRAANMRHLVADLRSTGELRDDLDDETAADLIWAMNSAEFFLLLRSRGHSPDSYARLVRETWSSTLLAPDSRGLSGSPRDLSGRRPPRRRPR